MAHVIPRARSAWGVVPVSVLTAAWMNGGVRQTPLRHPSYTHAMASRLVIPLALLALVATACSGGGESADTTPPTAIAPTTVDATTTTAATTTTSTTTTSTTTVPAATQPTAPPSTPAPTAPEVTASTRPLPVPDGFTLEEVQVIDRDFREGYRRYVAVLEDVNNEALVQAALEYTTGDETREVMELVEIYRTNNRRLERLPAPLESFEILQGPTTLTNGDVGLTLCHIAPYRNVEAPGGPGTAETVLNDTVFTQQISINLRLEDGVWKRSGNFFEGEWPGVVRCQDVS